MENRRTIVEQEKRKEALMPKNNKFLHLGFTLAEILITLVIIGVIAALTIPTLMNSTGDKEYVAASKRVLATVAEAGRQMAVEDDIKRYSNVVDFVENGLSKKVDINKYCAPTGTGSTQTTGVPTDCGFAQYYSRPEGDLVNSIDFGTNLTKTTLGAYRQWNLQDTPTGDSIKSYSFQMSNGYSVLLFYNKKCVAPPQGWITRRDYFTDYAPKAICISGVYDMNGKKGPNQAGRDLGFFAVEGSGATSMASVALPLTEVSCIEGNDGWLDRLQFCEDRNAILPNIQDLISMAMAYQLATPSEDRFWSGSPGGLDDRYWYVYFNDSGELWQDDPHLGSYVRCVRK